MARCRQVNALIGLLVALGLVGLWAGPASAQDSLKFQVIVHIDSPETSISRVKLSRLFLKKSRKWDDGSTVLPFDQEKGTNVRAAFLEEIHDLNEKEFAKYWIRLVFSGKEPAPEVLIGDDAVSAAVASNPRAIGYLSNGAAVPAGVKVLPLED